MTNVLVRLKDGVGELVLNRPKQRNSLTGPLVQELLEGIQTLTSNSDCRVVIVTGAQGYFCAGLDLKAFTADPEPEWKAGFQDVWARYHQAVFSANIPVIGAVEGFAIAGGSSLALSCDFLVMGKGAFMHVSEVERNMLAPLNVFWLTTRHSYQIALRLGLLGERWSAAELMATGIIERCVEDAEVQATAREMAQRFAGFDVENLKALKASIRAGACAQSAEDKFAGSLAAIKTAAQSTATN